MKRIIILLAVCAAIAAPLTAAQDKPPPPALPDWVIAGHLAGYPRAEWSRSWPWNISVSIRRPGGRVVYRAHLSGRRDGPTTWGSRKRLRPGDYTLTLRFFGGCAPLGATTACAPEVDKSWSFALVVR